MPYVIRLQNKNLKDIAGVISRDTEISVGAKNRLQMFLQELDKLFNADLDKREADDLAARMIADSVRLSDALVALVGSYAPPPDTFADLIDRTIEALTVARENRKAEALLIATKGVGDPSLTTHGNVMRLLERLPEVTSDRENRGDPTEAPDDRADGSDRSGVRAGTADSSAGTSERSDGAVGRPARPRR
jgi:hypothetical protein